MSQLKKHGDGLLDAQFIARHKQNRKKRTPAHVPASTLGDVEFCQRKIRLRNLHGNRVTPMQEASRTRGDRIHQAVFDERPAGASDKRCYVATCVYGADAPETTALRAWRDSRLKTTRAGRAFVSIYYAVSPVLVKLFGNNRAFRNAARWAINAVLRKVRG